MEVSGLSAKRCILHIDLDGFYAQVEQRRLGLSPDIPIAVQQWDGLIAINYAAKGRGVTRHMRVFEAKKICPELRCVHVQTIGGSVTEPQGAPSSEAAPSTAQSHPSVHSNKEATGGTATAMPGAEGSAEARSRAKACLQRYRLASVEIMRVLTRHLSHGAVMEKGGLDEVWVDVTPMVEAEMRALMSGTGAPPGAHVAVCDPPATDDDTHHQAGSYSVTGARPSPALQQLCDQVVGYSKVEGGVAVDMSLESDRRLVVAASISKRLRDAVLNDPACGYTCSAGIGPNKLVSKIGSARNKPAQQTLILPRAVAGLMADMPLSKVRGLGGKLGNELAELVAIVRTDTGGGGGNGGDSGGGSGGLGGATTPAVTAGDVQKVTMEALGRAVGERARWVFNVVRGIDDDQVKPKGLIKTINSCKTFNAVAHAGELARWMGILAEELGERLDEQMAEHRRRPKTLVLAYRSSAGVERSVRCAMPPPRDARSGPTPQALAASGLSMLRRAPDALPCVRLALSASGFHAPLAEGGAAITRFFAPPPTAAMAHPDSAPPKPPRAATPPSTSCAIDDPQQQQQRQQQQPVQAATLSLPPQGPDGAALTHTDTNPTPNSTHAASMQHQHPAPGSKTGRTPDPAHAGDGKRRRVGGVGGRSSLGSKPPPPAAAAPPAQPQAHTRPAHTSGAPSRKAPPRPTLFQRQLHALMGGPPGGNPTHGARPQHGPAAADATAAVPTAGPGAGEACPATDAAGATTGMAHAAQAAQAAPALPSSLAPQAAAQAPVLLGLGDARLQQRGLHRLGGAQGPQQPVCLAQTHGAGGVERLGMTDAHDGCEGGSEGGDEGVMEAGDVWVHEVEDMGWEEGEGWEAEGEGEGEPVWDRQHAEGWGGGGEEEVEHCQHRPTKKGRVATAAYDEQGTAGYGALGAAGSKEDDQGQQEHRRRQHQRLEPAKSPSPGTPVTSKVWAPAQAGPGRERLCAGSTGVHEASFGPQECKGEEGEIIAALAAGEAAAAVQGVVDVVVLEASDQEDPLLSEVDVEEQRRIMHDLQLQKLRAIGGTHSKAGHQAGARGRGHRATGGAGRGRGGGAGGKAGPPDKTGKKQLSIADALMRGR